MDFCCKSGRVDERMRRARSCGAGGIGKARLLKLTNGRRLLLGGAQIQRLLPRSFAAFPHVPVVEKNRHTTRQPANSLQCLLLASCFFRV